MNKQINLFWIALVLSAIIFTSCHVKSIALSQSDVVLAVNETVILIATTLPDNAKNKAVSWSSSDETVATVDTNGLVKALKAGTATITVKTQDGGVSATCSVTVTSMVKLDLKGKSFQMGSDYTGEKPVHKVTFTRDIYMCDHEVTQAEWQSVMGNNPSHFQGEEANKKVADGEVQENRPVESITWYKAVAFCNELTKKENITARAVAPKEIDYVYFSDDTFTTAYTTTDASSSKLPYMKIEATGYRLPTEAEWEYAARGGIADTDKAVWAGTTTESELGKYAWYTDNSDSKTHEVKKKKANGHGLYDMSGNVWEWCWDWYGDYTEGDAIDPSGAASGSNHVVRGGNCGGSAFGCCASERSYAGWPYDSGDLLGFRLVRTVQ